MPCRKRKSTNHRMRWAITFSALIASVQAWSVDIVDAYQMALQYDANWQANQIRRQIDEQNLGIAKAAILPVVGVNASYTKQYPHLDTVQGATVDPNQTITTKQAGIALQQPLFRMDVWQQYQKVRISQQLSILTLQAQQQQLMLDVATAYFSVLRQQSLLEVYQQEEDTLLRQYQIMQARFREGFVAKVDLNEAQAQYQSAQARRIAGDVQVQLSRQQLAQLIGQSPNQLARLKNNFIFTPPIPTDINAWVERAAQQNLFVNQRRVAYEIAAQQIKVDQAAAYPQLQAVAGTGWTRQSPNEGIASNGRVDRIGLELNWTAFDQTRGAIVQKSRLDAAAAYADIETAIRQAQTQTRQYYLQVTAANTQLQAYKTAMISAQSVAAAAQGSYREGLKTLVDVLIAQRNAFSAQQDYVNAQYDYLLNTLNLKAASGQLNEQDLRELNTWLR